MEVKRFRIESISTTPGCYWDTHPEGEWVKYSDHIAKVDELLALQMKKSGDICERLAIMMEQGLGKQRE